MRRIWFVLLPTLVLALLVALGYAAGTYVSGRKIANLADTYEKSETLAGVLAVTPLSELQKNDNASFLPEDAESTQVALVARRFNETGALPLIIVAERSEGLTPQDLGEARRLAGTLPERRFALDGDRRLGDYLVAGQPPAAIPSQDGKALLLVLALDAAKVSQRVGESTPVVAIGDDMRTLVEHAGIRADG